MGALAATAVACAVAPGVAGAAPVKGAYYVGTAPGAPYPSYVRVAADGRRLSDYRFSLRVACTDGKSRPFFRNEGAEPRFGLTADGRFDHRSRQFGTGTERYTGTFAGDQVTMTVAARTSNRGVPCSQDMPLTLRRVGSPLLAPDGALMPTGPFSVGRARGLRVTNLRTVGPARLVASGLTVSWRVGNCSSRRRGYRGFDRYFALSVPGSGRLSITSRGRHRIGAGRRVIATGRLSLRFRRSGAGYRVHGSYSATARLYRGSRRLDTCRFPRRTFTAAARR